MATLAYADASCSSNQGRSPNRSIIPEGLTTASEPLPALYKRVSPDAFDDPDATVSPENASKEMFMNRTTFVPKVIRLAAVLLRPIVYGEPDSKRHLVAFVKGNVVAMGGEHIIVGQTILTADERILTIGPADTIPYIGDDASCSTRVMRSRPVVCGATVRWLS